jgi:flagellar hook capping protein FlgD
MTQNQWTRLPVTPAASAASVPAEFALRPIVQMLGGGPVTLQLAIPSRGTLGAEVFSLDGRRVFTVPSAGCEAGERRITWDARTDDGHHAPAGLYFVRVQFQDGARTMTRSGRIIVLR